MTKQSLFVIGNAGNDPLARQVGEQTAVSFSLATNRIWNDSNGQRQERTQWFRVTAWNGKGESVSKHIRKGSQVLVMGRVTATPWIAKDGQPQATVDLAADKVVLLEKGGSHLETWVVGRLGQDPELRWTSSGVPVCSFSLATSRGYFNEAGEWVETTTWLKVITWRKLAELCAQYLSKGRLVFVQGDIAAEGWTGKDGQVRADLVLTAREVKFLRNGKKENGDESSFEEEAVPF